MSFIADVIYGLKIEYGKRIRIGRESTTKDLNTGIVTNAPDEFTIARAIPLPYSLRQAFLKSTGIHRTGYIEKGQSEVLIDNKDVPLAKRTLIRGASYIIDPQNRKRKIVRVDDYDEAFLLVVEDSPRP
jgi:hypothetical protein